jgi:hypothetical protein
LYVVLITSRKLRHYFEFYKITVVSEFLLGDILRNKEANGCIIKWAAELGMYFDGALNIEGARAGVLFVTPSKDELRYVLQIHFSASNNATKY